MSYFFLNLLNLKILKMSNTMETINLDKMNGFFEIHVTIKNSNKILDESNSFELFCLNYKKMYDSSIMSCKPICINLYPVSPQNMCAINYKGNLNDGLLITKRFIK